MLLLLRPLPLEIINNTRLFVLALVLVLVLVFRLIKSSTRRDSYSIVIVRWRLYRQISRSTHSTGASRGPHGGFTRSALDSQALRACTVLRPFNVGTPDGDVVARPPYYGSGWVCRSRECSYLIAREVESKFLRHHGSCRVLYGFWFWLRFHRITDYTL